MEIERKFLVNINSIKNIIENKELVRKEITQDYLYYDKFTAIRKRKIVYNNLETKYFYTIKTGHKGLSTNEIENEISLSEYNVLCINNNYHTLSKTRIIYPYLDDLKVEIDIFHGEYTGFVFAEIEFLSEEQAKNTSLPDFFGKELTNKITNAEMATMEIARIKDIINQ